METWNQGAQCTCTPGENLKDLCVQEIERKACQEQRHPLAPRQRLKIVSGVLGHKIHGRLQAGVGCREMWEEEPEKSLYYLIVVYIYVRVYSMVVAVVFECVWVCYLVSSPGSHRFAQIHCELPLYTKWVLNVGILLPRLLDSWNNALWSVFLFLKTLKKSAGVTSRNGTLRESLIVKHDVLKVLIISLNEKENISQIGSGIGFRWEEAESTPESACPKVWTGRKVHTQRCGHVGNCTDIGVGTLGSARTQV